jgi:hypothetical protein
MHEPHGPIILTDPVDRSHPLNRGRVLWLLTLPGLEGGRRWFDLTGLAHGTLENVGAAAGWRGTTRPGGWGHLKLDGTSNQDVLIPAVASPALAELTLATWVSTTTTGSDATQTLFHTVGAYSLETGCGNLGRPAVFTPGASWLYSSISVSDGAWHRVAFVFRAATREVWVDGRLGASDGLAGPAVTLAGGLHLGRRFDVAAGFVGALDDATVCNRAWSAAEVALDHDLSRRGYPGVLRRLGSRPWRSAPAGPAVPWHLFTSRSV